jgi:hypothetical protein
MTSRAGGGRLPPSFETALPLYSIALTSSPSRPPLFPPFPLTLRSFLLKSFRSNSIASVTPLSTPPSALAPSCRLLNLLSFSSPPSLLRSNNTTRRMASNFRAKCWVCGNLTSNRCSRCTTATPGIDIFLCSRACQKLVRPSPSLSDY